MYTEIFIYLVVVCLGLLIGSFLNALIFRLYSKESILKGRSKCPQCKKELRALELIPVFSFVVLRGKCKGCQKKISLQYPLVELFTSVLFAIGYLKYGLSLELMSYLVLVSFLVIIFVYDLKHSLILDKVSIPAIIIALLSSIFIFWLPLWDIFLGGLIGGGFFFLQHVISKGKWVGGGDIRLGLFMGLLLGWQRVLVALFLAYIVGAIFSLILLASKKKNIKSQIPFGTFLSIATVITMLFGSEIINWYLSLL